MAAKAIASIELLSVGTRVGAVANPLVREKESDCATEIKETAHNGGELQAKA